MRSKMRPSTARSSSTAPCFSPTLARTRGYSISVAALAQGGQVIGADLSTGMLTLAQAAIPGRAVQLDMRHLAFADGAFAGVWCMASLLHLPKADAPDALREMYRVLAPGGALVLGVQGGNGEGWEGVAYAAPAERFFARYQPEEVATLLTSTGFTVRQRGETDERGRHWLQWFAIRGA